MSQAPHTKVLFNAECPVCNLEIRTYERHAKAQGLPIRFDDLNTQCHAWGIDPDTAARRLYVWHDGHLTSGIPAFLVLWAQMPRYRWLGRVVGLPFIRPLAEFGYDRVLAPLIYRWHVWRKRQAASVSRSHPGR